MWYFVLATVIAVGFWWYKSTLQRRVDQARTEEEKKQLQSNLKYWKSWNLWVMALIIGLVGYQIWEWSEEDKRHQMERAQLGRDLLDVAELANRRELYQDERNLRENMYRDLLDREQQINEILANPRIGRLWGLQEALNSQINWGGTDSPQEVARKMAAIKKLDTYVRDKGFRNTSIPRELYDQFMRTAQFGDDDTATRPLTMKELNALQSSNGGFFGWDERQRKALERAMYYRDKELNRRAIGSAFVMMQRQYPWVTHANTNSRIREFLYGPRESFPNWKENLRYTRSIPRSIAPRDPEDP